MINLLKTFLAIFLAALASPATAGDFTILTNNVPPLKWVSDGLPSGITGDLLTRLINDVGYELDPGDARSMPLEEAYQAGKDTPGTIILGLARVPERENDFKWVGPIYNTSVGMIARKDRHVRISGMRDTKQYSVGTIRGSAAENIAFKYGLHETGITRFATTDGAIDQLVNGNIDLLVFPKSPAFYFLLQKRIKPNDFEFVFEMKSFALYFAFHKKTDNEVIKAFQDALDRLKDPDETGRSEYQTIVGKYFMPL